MFLFERNTAPLKILGHCKRLPQMQVHLWNNNTHLIEIFVKYIVYRQFVAASSHLENTVSFEEWMVATKEIKKQCALKKLFSTIRHSNHLQRKNVFRNNYFESQRFLLSCYFTKIFVHLSVITIVYYFSVYKLIGWNPDNVYLFK